MKSIQKTSVIATLSIAFLLSVILFACSKEKISSENTSKKDDISALIEKKTGLTVLKNEKEIQLINKNSNVNSSSQYYKSAFDNKLIVVTKFGNKYVLHKGVIANGEFIAENRFELVDNMDDNGVGNMTISNLDEGITLIQTYKNGTFSNEVQSAENNTVKKLCQREAGETFSQCNSRETDEFCDDFVSTVAYLTSPSIAVLIAALCTC